MTWNATQSFLLPLSMRMEVWLSTTCYSCKPTYLEYLLVSHTHTIKLMYTINVHVIHLYKDSVVTKCIITLSLGQPASLCVYHQHTHMHTYILTHAYIHTHAHIHTLTHAPIWTICSSHWLWWDVSAWGSCGSGHSCTDMGGHLSVAHTIHLHIPTRNHIWW